MKNKILLWVVKITAILLWMLTLFIPDIFEKIENVHVVGYKEIKQEESTPTFKTLEVEFSKKVLYGHIFIECYDENGKVLYGPVILFKDGDSQFAEVEIEYEKLYDCVGYRIKEAHMKTQKELMVDKISILLAVSMFFVVIAIIRIDYEEKVVAGKTVKVYSGLLNHRVKIEDEKVFAEKWFTIFRGKEVLLEVNKETDINIVFSAMNKISFEEIEKPVKEEVKEVEVVQEEKPQEEKKTPKKKTTSKAWANKVVLGASTKAKLTVKKTTKTKGNTKSKNNKK